MNEKCNEKFDDFYTQILFRFDPKQYLKVINYIWNN